MRKQLFNQKADCCGCEACANVCPKGVIAMEADPEGFFYPYITTPEACIDCSRCEKVCPIKNVSEVPDFQERAVAGYAKKQENIKASASGGLATAISKGFIEEHNAVVYGVSYTPDFLGVEYRRAETVPEIESFRTSKYVQARKNDVYQQVLEDLSDGKKVLFFGLPCDTYALQLFLGKKFKNLYVVALMCHGPSSPQVHRQYVSSLVRTHKKPMEFFSVRYKKEGWKPYYIKAVFSDGTDAVEKFDQSTYGIAFLYFKRHSCNVCAIKRSMIHADMTIGDYHLAAGGQYKPYHPDGVSSAMIHTEKGAYLASVAEEFYMEEIPVKNVLYSEAYHKSIPARKNRLEFGKVFAEKGLQAACQIKSISRIEKSLAFQARIWTYGAKVKKFLLRQG